MSLRLPAELKEWLEKSARDNGRSLNSEIVWALWRWRNGALKTSTAEQKRKSKIAWALHQAETALRVIEGIEDERSAESRVRDAEPTDQAGISPTAED